MSPCLAHMCIPQYRVDQADAQVSLESIPLPIISSSRFLSVSGRIGDTPHRSRLVDPACNSERCSATTSTFFVNHTPNSTSCCFTSFMRPETRCRRRGSSWLSDIIRTSKTLVQVYVSPSFLKSVEHVLDETSSPQPPLSGFRS